MGKRQGEPRPPRHLSAESKALWNQVNGDFELESDALAILRVALEQFDRAQQARKLLAKDGLVLDGKRHPATDVEKTAYGLFLRAMRQLGLDVVAPGPMGRPVAGDRLMMED
jgi:hypothetical protein